MKQIVLIACAAKKRAHKAKARDLYASPLFTYSLAYAEALKPDKIFILSARHYLLAVDTEIEPYDVTLSHVTKGKRKPGLKVLNLEEKRDWGKTVVHQLSRQADLKKDVFIFLAGLAYIIPLQGYVANVVNPLAGLSQGKRLEWLKTKMKETRTYA